MRVLIQYKNINEKSSMSAIKNMINRPWYLASEMLHSHFLTVISDKEKQTVVAIDEQESENS